MFENGMDISSGVKLLALDDSSKINSFILVQIMQIENIQTNMTKSQLLRLLHCIFLKNLNFRLSYNECLLGSKIGTEKMILYYMLLLNIYNKLSVRNLASFYHGPDVSH